MSGMSDYVGDDCPKCGATPMRGILHICPDWASGRTWSLKAQPLPMVMTGGLTPPVPDERKEWLARGLAQLIDWIALDGHVPPEERTLRRIVRRWLLRRTIRPEQLRWAREILHGNYPSERYPDHPGVKP